MTLAQGASKVAHYLAAGLGVVLAGVATHITQGDVLSWASLEHWAGASFIVWLSSLFVSSVGPAKPTAGFARLGVLLALLVAAPVILACPPANADAASVEVMAVGDSAVLTFHWPAVNKATGYIYSVITVASNGTWTNPTNVAIATTAGSAVSVSATADTAVFQVCATALGAAASSPVGCSSSVANAKNTWHRKLVAPAPQVDTVSIRPNPITMQLASSRIACAFQGFHDGQMGERTADKPACDSLYRKAFSLSHRRPTAAEQLYADTATWAWSTSKPSAIGLVPQGFGSSAVMVQANGLTRLNRGMPVERYAGNPDPVARLDSTFRMPDGGYGASVTCLRPGVQRFTVSVETIRQTFDVTCDPLGALLRIAADASRTIGARS